MATTRRSEIVQALAFGTVGLLVVGFGVFSLVLNPERPLPYEFALGILMLVLAAQLAAGVTKVARDWVDRAFGLVLVGALLPSIVKGAVASVVFRSVLAAAALVMLLVAARWLLGRRRTEKSTRGTLGH